MMLETGCDVRQFCPMTADNDPKAGTGDAAPAPRRAGNGARENPKSWSNRLLRAMFGWSPTSIRSDLQVLLEGEGAETGFSPEESRMLKNILSLRERRVDDVMVPRTDIVAVQQDVALGDLLKVFKDAAHSRLVVYNDTLDDPIGMVHIRDMIAFMMAQAATAATETRATEAGAARGEPHPAGLDLSAVDLARPLSTTKIVRTMLFVPPSMPAIDLLAKSRRRASISRWSSTSMAAPKGSSRSRTSSRRSSARSTTSTTRRRRRP